MWFLKDEASTVVLYRSKQIPPAAKQGPLPHAFLQSWNMDYLRIGIQSRIHTIACSSTPLSSPLLWIAVYHVLAGILRSSTFTVCLCMVCKKRFDPKCRSSGMHGKLFRHEKLITLCHWTYFEEYLSKYIHNHPQLVVDLVHKVRPKPKWNKPGNDLSFFHMDNTTYIPRRQRCSYVPA